MKVTVGKANKKRVRKYLLILFVFMSLLFSPFLIVSIYYINDLTFTLSGLFLTMIIIFIVAVFVIPGIAFMDFMWEVDEHYFRFTTFESMMDKTRLYYSRFLKSNFSQYQMSLKMSQIDFIQVTYYQQSFYPSKYLYGGAGYKVVFKFHMLDGSQYLFENFVGSDEEVFNAGIQFMKNYGIQFVDRYKILNVYKEHKNIQHYLASIEKENDHD